MASRDESTRWIINRFTAFSGDTATESLRFVSAERVEYFSAWAANHNRHKNVPPPPPPPPPLPLVLLLLALPLFFLRVLLLFLATINTVLKRIGMGCLIRQQKSSACLGERGGGGRRRDGVEERGNFHRFVPHRFPSSIPAVRNANGEIVSAAAAYFGALFRCIIFHYISWYRFNPMHFQHISWWHQERRRGRGCGANKTKTKRNATVKKHK